MKKFKKFTKNINANISRHSILIGFSLILIYFIPFIILGEDSCIKVHDNLDCEFLYRVLLARSENLLDPHFILPNVMNGLPSSSLPTRLNIGFLFFLFLPPFYAFIVNTFMVKIAAFIGMYFLLTRYIYYHQNSSIPFWLALCFCFIPFYSIHGLSSAGLPLIVFALLNLWSEKWNWYNYLIIIVFGFYSSLVLAGIFLLFLIFIFLIIGLIKKKKINIPFLAGFIILIMIYFLTEYELIKSMFFSQDYLSHRTSWIPAQKSCLANIKETIKLLLVTQYHSGTMKSIIILFSIFPALFLYQDKNRKAGIRIPFSKIKLARPDQLSPLLLSSLVLTAAILIFHFLFQHIQQQYSENLPLLRYFHFDRFYFFLPLLWLIIFASSLKRLKNQNLIILTGLLIACHFSTVIYVNKNYQRNISCLLDQENHEKQLTFKKYFDTDLFSKIDKFIGKNKHLYRIASIGLQPGITQYNGFYTLDSYQNNYKLKYKEEFRKIIEKELLKNEQWKKYYDNWGSRCYLFCAELDGFQYSKYENKEIRNLQLNTNKFREMGGEYIFSTVRILNAGENRLELRKIFESEKSYWRIYLYKIINTYQ